MEINWVILGWLIDMTLNGFVWLVIAAIFLLLIDVTDTWTKKAIQWMGKACLLYTSPSPRDGLLSRMPSSA